MRVITGLYKGRALLTVRNFSVRPATDRVRQTIFDMLANRMAFDGAQVLDLFAGSGSLGIEALSRGAAHATFVEHDHEAACFIGRNLRALGCESSGDVLELDARSYLECAHGPFDLVFADPPYAYARTADLPALAFGGGFVRHGGYLIIEHAQDLEFAERATYSAGPVKKFGRTRVTFLQPINGRNDAP